MFILLLYYCMTKSCIKGIGLCKTKEEIQDNINLGLVTFKYFGISPKKCVLYIINQNLFENSCKFLYTSYNSGFFQLPSAS
jgi:hypothetical protein